MSLCAFPQAKGNNRVHRVCHRSFRKALGCVVPKTVAGALSALPELQYMEYRAPDVESVDA